MSINKYFLLFVIISLFSCKHKDVEKKEVTVSYDSTYFGQYYRIGKYNLYVPFGDKPEAHIIVNNDKLMLVEHKYSQVSNDSQETYIYIASIINIKDSTIINSGDLPKFRIEDIIAESVQMGADLSKYNPKQIYYDTILFYNKYAINQKHKLSIPYADEIHEQYLYNCIFSLDSVVVKLSVITPPIDKSINIAKGFFNSIKIK